MSNMLNTPLEYKSYQTSLTVTNTTLAKIVVDCQPAGVATAVSGETALPGEATVRQRIRQGGCRVIGGSISSTDSVAASLLIYKGSVLTTQDADTTGVMALTTGSITRASGSFITDGWKPGDMVMLFGPSTSAYVGSATQGNVGKVGLISAVTATTLTVAASTYTADATLPTGARLARMSQRTRRAVAANAGNADATPAVALMGGTQDPASAALPDTGWELGQTDLMAVAVVSNLSTIPARLDIDVEVGLR